MQGVGLYGPDRAAVCVFYVKRILKHAGCCITDGMIREEGLFYDGILRIGHKRTGEWNAVPAMILRDVGIQDAEASYHGAVFVGQQRIGDGILFCEFP